MSQLIYNNKKYITPAHKIVMEMEQHRIQHQKELEKKLIELRG
jgi:hypothetical protein